MKNPKLVNRTRSPAERLDELSRLEPDWDSYGGLPPSSEALASARALLRVILAPKRNGAGSRITPFSIVPIADGGVQLEWRGARADLELNVGPDGALSYLLIERGGDERSFQEGDDLPRAEALRLIDQVTAG